MPRDSGGTNDGFDSAERRTASRLQPIDRRLDQQRFARHERSRHAKRGAYLDQHLRRGILRSLAKMGYRARMVDMAGVVMQRSVQLRTCPQNPKRPNQ